MNTLPNYGHYTGIEDKNGNPVYEAQDVYYEGKQYTVMFHPAVEQYVLFDERVLSVVEILSDRLSPNLLLIEQTPIFEGEEIPF